ncbi:hypothetical protein Dde_3449 [Oleidesulfovibrio alaskensis G20]|jgi:hypothetical protein|uniref:4Fe-4S ferredoxin-type domain-containing protein n=1 Tax=Oleidesulfovibrio alaskensis (strain ATCC BAA-1058 / DSM 17464 / G20) TaxID=207559 RepID=Q30VQ4_OLEA2|nr:hypothetical protein [Oleidesulfovibrio alaskensis]ABB40242.1 hypothetical protein Dde_3449 [Oleidesulfovibrio alaskensis G20]
MSAHACVGCGYCCVKSQCPPSNALFGPRRICPALYWNGECYRCALAEQSGAVGRLVHVGSGCCSPLNRWRLDVRPRIRTDTWKHEGMLDKNDHLCQRQLSVP